MKRTTASERRVFSDMRFLMNSAKHDTPDVVGHTVAAAVLEVLSSLGDWLVLPCFLYMLEADAPAWGMFIALTAALALVRFITHYEHGVFARSRDRFRTYGSTRLAQKALCVPYADAVDASHLKALSRATQAMGRHIEAPIPHMWKTVSTMLIYLVTATVYSVVLCRYHVGLWCLTAATAVLGALVHRFVSDRGSRERDGEAACDVTLAYVCETAQSPQFSKDIRVFSLAPWLKAIYDSGFRAAQAFSRDRAVIYALYNVAEALLILLSNGMAYLVLVYAARQAALPVSALCLYLAAIGGLTWAVRGFAEDALTLKTERAALAAYRCVIECPDALSEDGEMPAAGVPHTIEVRDVTFTHRGAVEPTLEHVSFTWHRGEKLAVVGQDGHGKSTLAKLLCGLYDPDEGEILLDGVDVRQLSRRAYYALFSVVLQDTALPDMTLAELVTADSALDEDRLIACLTRAGAMTFAAALPQGVHTVIGRTAFEDGAELSGGQMQRLLLARALYKDGDLLILDEPTAALDPLAEGALYRDYDRLIGGRGAMIMSHRLASTRFCDRILVLKHGAVCEEGTHEDLLKQGGEYARLFTLQSRYYREGRDPS